MPVGSSRLALSERLGMQNISIDSTGNATSQSPDTLKVIGKLKSPLAAVLFSIFPGGGQIYNGSYWKVPIIWGVQGYFVYEWIQNNKVYQSLKQEVSDSIAAGTPYISLDHPLTDVKTLIGLRDGAQNTRDSYAWYIAGAYLLSMLDAYVDAELSGFNVSPNLSSSPMGKVFALSFRMKF